MGNRRAITTEEQTAAMTAIKPYLEQGWTFYSAYRQVAADYQLEGKTIPAEVTMRRWCKKAGWTGNGDRELVRMNTERTEGTEGTEAAGTDEAARDPEEADAETDEAAENPEEAAGADDAVQQDPDYTRRLELMCRLYRTRSENACDAICDKLLPELFTEEN